MIKITKPGKKEFPGHCKWCGCEFTYDDKEILIDVRDASKYALFCPHCERKLYHLGEHGTYAKAPNLANQDDAQKRTYKIDAPYLTKEGECDYRRFTTSTWDHALGVAKGKKDEGES
jgi:hypothetical protein